MSPCGLGGGQTSTGGPLTEFGRGRPNLPLPLERVKSRGPGGCRCLAWWVLGRALTDFRRRRRNPSASSGRVLPLPQARGRSAGRWGRGLGCVQAVGRMCSVLGAICSVFRRMCSVSGPMCSVFSRMCSLLRAMCSVFGGARPRSRPPLAGSEQALQGRRDDGGSGREAGGAHPGMCQLCRANVSRFWLDVSTFRPNVSSFRPDVFTLAGQVFGEEGVSGA